MITGTLNIGAGCWSHIPYMHVPPFSNLRSAQTSRAPPRATLPHRVGKRRRVQVATERASCCHLTPARHKEVEMKDNMSYFLIGYQQSALYSLTNRLSQSPQFTPVPNIFERA